jgi:predicted nucleic acid-binding protein
MNSYALDTNIVSYYLNGDKRIIDRVNVAITGNDTIVIPPMVYFEIKRWLLLINTKRKLSIFEDIYACAGIDILDKDILDIAASIYVELQKKGASVDDADILIAAYCIKHSHILVTNNIRHFEGINDLQIVNWMD